MVKSRENLQKTCLIEKLSCEVEMTIDRNSDENSTNDCIDN